MKKEKSKQHIQVPNKMTEQNKSLKPGDLLIYATIKSHRNKDTKECFPSLSTISKESGASINTVRNSIQNLINTGYIDVEKRGRGKSYIFLKEGKFEPFSEKFLKNPNLTFKEKAYILATQQYMFKNKETQDGIITYSNIDLANKINISPTTITRMDNALIKKDILQINTLSQKNQETGLPIKEKIFHLSKIEQAIVFILGNHENRIENAESKINLIEKVLKAKLNVDLNKLLEEEAI